MILSKLIKSMAEQNWFSVLLEVLIVVVGIFLGIQATQWHEERQSRADGYYYLDLLQRQLSAEIQEREKDIASISNNLERVRNALELLYTGTWSENDYSQFKSDHPAIYTMRYESMRPSALRQLLDAGKIDLIESRSLQESLFNLERVYQEAILQSEIAQFRRREAVTVLSTEIAYGVGDDLMAISAEPDALLASATIKSAVRSISVINRAQLGALETLQKACVVVHGELDTYLASRMSRSAT